MGHTEKRNDTAMSVRRMLATTIFSEQLRYATLASHCRTVDEL